ncbi:methylosome subunit pICln-like [Chanos chanos]|uniref:Methylosome subunit pICln n=1 Tax=Chanos chanos TaxID=29144 RepID=A0A6J2WV82_CHACN|nr:methylosome subunit pICln-like [Chanos chanos]
MVFLQTVSPPSEGVRHEQAETTAVLDGKGLGSGTLCVAETRVSWFDGSGFGFDLEYPSISLHAISRDLSSYPKEHLYVVVSSRRKDFEKEEDKEEGEDETSSDEEEEEDDDDDGDDGSGPITEIRFVPNDKASLETLFSAILECQALHPDPDDSDSDFDGDEYDVEEAEQGRIDLPTLYSFEKGLSQLAVESPAPQERAGGSLPQSGSPPHARTDDSGSCSTGELRTDACVRGVPGQSEEADIDHW